MRADERELEPMDSLGAGAGLGPTAELSGAVLVGEVWSMVCDDEGMALEQNQAEANVPLSQCYDLKAVLRGGAHSQVTSSADKVDASAAVCSWQGFRL